MKMTIKQLKEALVEMDDSVEIRISTPTLEILGFWALVDEVKAQKCGDQMFLCITLGSDEEIPGADQKRKEG